MKKILSAVAALVLGLGLAAGLGAAPASAHTAIVTGTAVCEDDGTYTVNWTVTLSDYGSHQEIALISLRPDSTQPGCSSGRSYSSLAEEQGSR